MLNSRDTNNDTVSADSFALSFAASFAGVIAFITVAAEGSFSRAADRLNIGRSAVSRSVQKLEDQLGVRLFIRTTRSTSLTAEGELFYKNCHSGVERIIQAIDDMHDLKNGPPRGLLRISADPGFGRGVVAPLLHDFSLQYPEIALDLVLDERQVDFSGDRVDVAFRNGRLEDSQVIAKKLMPMQMLVCASSEYASKFGLPNSLDDLLGHSCINFRNTSGRTREWEFIVAGEPRRLAPASASTFNDTDALLQAVLHGRGIAQLPGYQICDHIRSGRLIACLHQYAPIEQGHYICYPSRQHQPARIRVFLNYMASAICALDFRCMESAPLHLPQGQGESHTG